MILDLTLGIWFALARHFPFPAPRDMLLNRRKTIRERETRVKWKLWLRIIWEKEWEWTKKENEVTDIIPLQIFLPFSLGNSLR